MSADKAALFAFYWRVYAEHTDDLPAPVSEYPDKKRGELPLIEGRKFRVDFAWPDLRIIVEVEGGRWQAGGGRHNSDSDFDKYNLLTAAGWRVFRVSTQRLESDPASFIAFIAGVVRRELAALTPNK